MLDTVRRGDQADLGRRRAPRATSKRPAWPMIVFRTPKGWTCPPEIDGKKCEDYWRSHQVPMGDMDKPEHIRILEQWMKSYRPEELFDAQGRLKPEFAELAPKGHRRMSDNPHANGGLLLRDLKMPDFRDYAVKVPSPGATTAESAREMGKFLRDVMKQNLDSKNFRLFSPDENNSNRWQDVLDVTNALLHGRDLSGRRQAQPGRPRDGSAQRAPVPGLAGRLPADGPARLLLVLRGVHPHHRFDVQPARQVAEDVQPHPVAAADRLVQLLPQLARLAAGPQRLEPPGSRLHRPRRQQEGRGRFASICRPTPTPCCR